MWTWQRCTLTLWRSRNLCAFVGRDLLEGFEAQEMLGYTLRWLQAGQGQLALQRGCFERTPDRFNGHANGQQVGI